MRYDPTGQVIAQTEPGQSWRVLLWPKYGDVVTTAATKKWTVLDDNGYVTATLPGDRSAIDMALR